MILLIWLLMQRGVRAFSYLSSRYPHYYISYAIASLFLRLDNLEYIILNQRKIGEQKLSSTQRIALEPYAQSTNRK